MADIKNFIEEIKKLSVMELNELVKAIEEEFGVSAAAPMMMAGAAAGPVAEAEEEKTEFDVILTGAGANKIAVIKAVREILPGLGLVDAKGLVDGAPKPLKEGVSKEEANEIVEKIKAAGGTAEVK
ncbi:MAG: 50S ribosomal protein L7/L12 [Christensenellales bacterium]|jgi:large subunit ribosomal protein L7/L12|nr:50S ribosomal protein L7/L12 [Clostridiales bacterium]